MCSGMCPRSCAAFSRILTLSFMCFWPIYSPEGGGRKFFSSKTSSFFLPPPWRGSIVFSLDFLFIICYIIKVVGLSTGYQHSYTHYSIYSFFFIVQYFLLSLKRH